MNRLARHLKEVSSGSSYLHSEQALFVAIGAGGRREGVCMRGHDLADRAGMSITYEAMTLPATQGCQLVASPPNHVEQKRIGAFHEIHRHE
jgi:hypothetical protein